MYLQSLSKRINQRARRSYFRWNYMRTARQVLATPPLKKGLTPFVLLSMVHQRDVLSYLLAVKSFAHFTDPERIVIVCDPSITQADRAVLREHIPHLEFRDADEFVDPKIPRGGVWERLYAIAGYAEHAYVVQLDADTLTTQAVPEVMAAVGQKRGFVLGECTGQQPMTLSQTADNARPWLKTKPPVHIQAIVEANIDTAALPATARYIRGCAGFCGFPCSSTMREQVLDFSSRMQAKFGQDWKRWGTEQVTSNYIVANSNDPIILPFPKYSTPDSVNQDIAFFHFIGSVRFVDDLYRRTSEAVLKKLGNYK